MDLAREILLRMEQDDGMSEWVELAIEGRTPEEVSYHVMLLDQAGLIEGRDDSTFDGDAWKAQRLTWQGHEFLDSARNESAWKEAKRKIAERGGSLTFDVLKAVLAAIVKGQLGL